MVNEDEDANMCPICYEELSDNTRGQPVIFHVPPNGIPHRSHFNCVKDWVINRINQNAVITCPQCNQTLNFIELPIELQEDADIQQAYNAQQDNAPQVQAQQIQAQQQANAQQQQWQQVEAAVAAHRERERIWGPIVIMLLVALFAWSINYLLNSIPRVSELTPEEREQMQEQIEEFLRQLNNTFTEFFNNNQM